ncbi:MAG: prolyl oligopeptidase family serine peptidase [Myxococcota bacterium]
MNVRTTGLLMTGMLALNACAHSSPAQNSGSSSVQPSTGERMSRLNYPTTRAESIEEQIFGQSVKDPYRWLEDPKSSEVQSWVNAQDNLARSYLDALPGRAQLEARLKALSYVDSMTAPTHRNGRYFYSRRHADKEKGIVYWKQGETGKEQVLIDPNTLSADGSIALGTLSISYDGKLAAFSLKANNADEATLYLMDVETGKRSEIDVIPGAKYAYPEWAPDNQGFYYTWLPVDPSIPASERPGYAEVRYHRVGTSPAQDTIIKERTGNPQTFVGADISRDGRWLIYKVQRGWNSTHLYVSDQKAADKSFKPFVLSDDSVYELIPWGDAFYIYTNEGAPRYRLFKAPAGLSDRSAWKEIVPQQEAVLDNVQVVGNKLALTWSRNVTSLLEIRDLDGKLIREVALPGMGTTYGMTGEPEEDTAYFMFMSLIYPPEIYKTSIKTGDTSRFFSVLLPIQPDLFETEQVWYPSKDGTKISMFIVRKKGAPKDGKMPIFLTGYGGFNVSMTPTFSATRFAWLEAGGGFAMPNLRGGGEYGEAWHRAGMLENKQNVFDDFIAASEYLIREKYTSADKLVISGGSNGGLLMGAMVTQRPELFKAVVCSVPLLDMVRYHLFGSGRTWIPEYGTAENEADFKWIYAYSPYHRVVEGTSYPAFLMQAADNDDRVDPLHARKFTARLQAAQGGAAPVIMRVERNAGHGGGDMVKKQIDQLVDMYSFVMHQVGIVPKNP